VLRHSKIVREDEYRKEVRGQASLLVSSARQFRTVAMQALRVLTTAMISIDRPTQERVLSSAGVHQALDALHAAERELSERGEDLITLAVDRDVASAVSGVTDLASKSYRGLAMVAIKEAHEIAVPETQETMDEVDAWLTELDGAYLIVRLVIQDSFAHTIVEDKTGERGHLRLLRWLAKRS